MKGDRREVKTKVMVLLLHFYPTFLYFIWKGEFTYLEFKDTYNCWDTWQGTLQQL